MNIIILQLNDGGYNFASQGNKQLQLNGVYALERTHTCSPFSACVSLCTRFTPMPQLDTSDHSSA